MLPVLQTEVFCDGVEDVHLIPQLGLRVDVSHPQAAGVLCYVADLDLDNTDVLMAGRPSHSVSFKDKPACLVSSAGES